MRDLKALTNLFEIVRISSIHAHAIKGTLDKTIAWSH